MVVLEIKDSVALNAMATVALEDCPAQFCGYRDPFGTTAFLGQHQASR